MITNYPDICFICGKPKQHTHHLICGSFRKQCDADQLVIPICFECHEALHRSGIAEHFSKVVGQMQWEGEHRKDGEDPKATRMRFMEVYGRSWI